MRSFSSLAPGRAAAHQICAACRREAQPTLAVRGTSFATASRVTIPSRRALQTATISRPQTSITAARRSLYSQRRPNSTTTTTSTTTTDDSSSSSSTPSEIPAYYALFPQTLPDGPPPAGKFAIDLRALRAEFLRLQAASHPDFHHHAAQPGTSDANNNTATDDTPDTNASTSTNNSKNKNHSPARIRAEATSALINTAYKTLSSPLLRAQYLLHELHHIDLEGDEANQHGGAPDPELLMTVLEAREVMEEAQTEADLEGVRVENEGRIEACEEGLGRALEEGDVQGARAEAVRLRYWVNIREGVRGWERGKEVVLQH
ncbi:HSCB C-terminal oligomerization domain-containing protein [Dichotomopilus funicola]|uniref:HSCB C-terminal oligomerization domain-containing protein n=1 Tax=Dichotomopilus funicola TaxID=1934379 RepID=A0AAN6UVT1_9PEZI|nr:HSCB C-terminal oligomerization domain-containing protein [Dichotomopilus funicola]